MLAPGGQILDNLSLYRYYGRMTSYQNEAGEYLMDGAAIRFEQQLDSEYAEERARMAYDDDYYADAPDLCYDCGEDEDNCVCEPDTAGIQNFGGEDSWLDGSYEE